MTRMQTDSRADRGAALIVAILAMTMMTALGAALVLTTLTETRVASAYADGIAVRYAAEGALERVLADLHAHPDWSTLPTTHSDGPLQALLPAATRAPTYRVRVTIAPGEAENAIVVEARAYGPAAVERAVSMTVERTGGVDTPVVRVLAWAEVP